MGGVVHIIDESLLGRELSSAQLPAVLNVEGPCLILAGAGSGKTRTLIFKIAHLISCLGVDPRQILAVTFTNKAAGEMKARLSDYLGQAVSMPWMGTFHSLCVRFLREILPEQNLPGSRGEGWTRRFSIYDDDDQKKVINQLLKEYERQSNQGQGGFGSTIPELKEVKGMISFWKSRLISPDEARRAADTDRDNLRVHFYEKYQSELRSNNALDFDDLMGLTVRILEADVDLATDWASWFQFRFIDEYQDTNPVQYRLMRLLCGWHPAKRDSKWRDVNITAVGDDDQGIYSWRGADITILRDFARDFNVKEDGIYKLEENYRSSRRIVEAAASLIVHNPKEAHLQKNIYSQGALGDLIRLIKLPTDREEGDLIAREIRARGIENLPKTAVFYRTNAQSRMIEESLRRHQIAYRIVGGFSFYERKEIKDVLAYLKVLINPQDELSLERILNYPPRNIGDQKQKTLKSWALQRDVGMWEALAHVDEILGSGAQAPVKDFYTRLLQWTERAEDQSLVTTVEMILEESKMLSYLEGKKDESDALANVKELLSSVVEAVEMDPGLDLSVFLQQISLQTSADQVDEGECVTLMTLHGSKGLEFPFVYICGCEEGFLPMGRAGEAPNEEEERRLFYVGMTRAREQLTLLCTSVRKIFGRDEYGRRPSPFLDEIDKQYIEVIDKTGRVWNQGGEYRSSNNRYSGSASNFASAGPSSRMENARVVLRRSTSDDFEDESPIRVGKVVEHGRFGPGKIMQVSGQGPDAKIKIRFGDGERTLIAKYANLRPFDGFD